MSRQYDHWIHTQLEPNDIIIVGNAKRFANKIKVIDAAQTTQWVYEEEIRSEQEHDRLQDEYLKSKGII